MGVVYKARDLRLKRMVALKVISDDRSTLPEDVARFVKEAETVAHLQHPHIVPIYEVSSKKGRPFFTMEFVEGGNLSKRLRQNSLSSRVAAELVEKLSRGECMPHIAGV